VGGASRDYAAQRPGRPALTPDDLAKIAIGDLDVELGTTVALTFSHHNLTGLVHQQRQDLRQIVSNLGHSQATDSF
jgi:hypothetical protein